MFKNAKAQQVFLMLMIIWVIFTSAACVHVMPQLSIEEINQLYADAVKDAEIAEPHEISKNLLAIIPSNDKLEWNVEKTAVLVTTWTAWNGYDAYAGQEMITPKTIWVTLVPEIQDFYQSHQLSPKDIPLRLEQVLGLPPQNGKTRFVELWVSPQDLFRPAPDPEISDHEAEINLPISSRYVTVDATYQEWFTRQMQESYGENGYPWTRLGYTYDWGNPTSEVGLSEFVIRADAKVVVNRVFETLEYFQQIP